MPRVTLAALRRALPKTMPFLMYGLTEAFRSTYLPPAEIDRRPDSIGKAIPNAEILVVREDGRLARLASRGNWCIAVRWSGWVTGMIRPRPPNATARPPGNILACPSRNWQSGRATRCGWMKTVSCTSSAARTT